MKPIDINNPKLDQSEVQSICAQMQLHAANLRGLLAANEAETIQPPRLSATNDIENIGLLTEHITELEHRIGANCPQFNFAISHVNGFHGLSRAARPLQLHGSSAVTAPPNLSNKNHNSLRYAVGRGGKMAAAKVNFLNDISRLESQLQKFPAGGTSAKALERKISDLRVKLAAMD